MFLWMTVLLLFLFKFLGFLDGIPWLVIATPLIALVLVEIVLPEEDRENG
jgi:hypothetical protein